MIDTQNKRAVFFLNSVNDEDCNLMNLKDLSFCKGCVHCKIAFH